MPRSQENQNEKAREGYEKIGRLVEEMRNTAKGDKHQLKELSKRIKKCIKDRKKSKTTRKDAADSRIIRRHQEYIMQKIWKEKNAHPESKKTTKARQSHQEKVLQMSSLNCTANFMPKSSWIREKYMTIRTWKQE